MACQASVYTPDEKLEVTRLLRGLSPVVLARFNTQPEVVSHPASPHPRVLLHSETGMWRCEIAADRTDFYWLRPEACAPSPSLGDFFEIAAGLLGHYAEVTGSRVGRLAAIVRWAAAHTAPALFAVGHFTRPALAGTAFEGTEAFEVYAHRQHALDRFLVNASMRCTAGAGGALTLSQDLNTLTEQAASRRFTLPDLTAFFGCAARAHERTLELYFPEAL